MRPVKDDVVIKNCMKSDKGLDLLNKIGTMPLYDEPVYTGLESVKLEEDFDVFIPFSLQDGWKVLYNSFKIPEDCDHEIHFEGMPNPIKCTLPQLKLLKFLAIEQLNKNEDYSEVVFQCFRQVLEQVCSGNFTGKLAVSPDCDLFEKVIIGNLQEFINSTVLVEVTK